MPAAIPRVDAPPRRRWGRRLLGVSLIALLWATAPAAARSSTPVPAHAGDERDISSAELRSLAARADGDAAALDALRAVRSVDGQPVDMATALGGATGPDLSARLRTLAAGGVGSPSAPPGQGQSGGHRTSPAKDRRAAGEILDRDRYQPRRVPRPFRGALRWLGDRLEPVFGPVGGFLASVVDEPLGAVAVGLLVAAAAAAAAWLAIGRRTRTAVIRREHAAGGAPGEDPAELERRADEAEAAGRLEDALRLRFRAGLLRLDGAGVLRYRPEATSGELASTLGSPSFTGLAATFDEVVYGERPAEAGDLASARVAWPKVPTEAGGR